MNEFGLYLYLYLFVINVLAFGLYAIDKRRAVYKKWRIPEAILLGLAVIGGAYGAGIAMLLFRHKTQHMAFYIAIPVCFTLWMIFLVFLCIQ